MGAEEVSANIDHVRRRLMGVATAGIAAAGATRLFSSRASAAPAEDLIRSFSFHASKEDLDALRRGVAATRWPGREAVTDATQGAQLATVKKLASYRSTDYDWTTCESKLNALPQFVTTIDGLDIHFIHVRSSNEKALPLIVTHGWPGSVIEPLKIIDPCGTGLLRQEIHRQI
jgi:hypothetical protein